MTNDNTPTAMTAEELVKALTDPDECRALTAFISVAYPDMAGTPNLYEKCAAALPLLKRQPQDCADAWIRAKDRLPEFDVPVLGWSGALGVFQREKDMGGWQWARQIWGYNLTDADGFEIDQDYEVKYWMPLPPMPKGPCRRWRTLQVQGGGE